MNLKYNVPPWCSLGMAIWIYEEKDLAKKIHVNNHNLFYLFHVLTFTQMNRFLKLLVHVLSANFTLIFQKFNKITKSNWLVFCISSTIFHHFQWNSDLNDFYSCEFGNVSFDNFEYLKDMKTSEVEETMIASLEEISLSRISF